MPRYNYRCSSCQHESIIFHLISETAGNCTECALPKTLVKQLTSPLYATRHVKAPAVGEITKDYIEQNRELLEEEKTKRETYEPT